MNTSILKHTSVCGILFAVLNTASAQWSGTNPVTTTSKVGVGTTTPAAKTEIVNDRTVALIPNAFQVKAKLSPSLFSTDLVVDQNGWFGVGTATPRARQELLYCPPPSVPQIGLMVTKYDCNGFNNYLPSNYGIKPGTYTTGGSGTPDITFTTPFNYNIFPITNALNPLPTTGTGAPEQPLFWARTESQPMGGPNEYETKLIVMPSGNTGINLSNPRAALDVRVLTGRNEPAAIFGAIAPGTQGTNASGLYTYKTQHLQFVPVLDENGYNQIVKKDDAGLFFTDGKGTDGANFGASFVIAPWANNRNSAVGGLRMDNMGNVEVHGNLRCTKNVVNQKWWADRVFGSGYVLMPLEKVEQYIKLHQHLPEVPSEAEIKEKGLDMGEMQAIQMQKIEELTLYTIEQQKQLQAQNGTIAIQQEQIAALQQQLDVLRAQMQALVNKQ